MSSNISIFQSIWTWVQQHRLLSLAIVLVLVLIGLGVGPAYNALAHANAQDCGQLYATYGRQPPLDANKVRQAHNCFMLAHQQCRAAMISYSEHGVDTGSTATFRTANRLDGCSLSEEVDTFGMLGERNYDYACSDVVQKPDGLHFLHCGDAQEVILPINTAR